MDLERALIELDDLADSPSEMIIFYDDICSELNSIGDTKVFILNILCEILERRKEAIITVLNHASNFSWNYN